MKNEEFDATTIEQHADSLTLFGAEVTARLRSAPLAAVALMTAQVHPAQTGT